MKSIFALISFGTLLILASCSGSETYRGDWKATDPKGNQFEINFQEKSFSIQDSAGEKTQYEYTQNEVQNDNGVMSYGIRLGDGRKLQVRFPFDADQTKGFILDANDHVMYTIARERYMRYEEVYQL
jgi:hypothetical protein